MLSKTHRRTANPWAVATERYSVLPPDSESRGTRMSSKDHPLTYLLRQLELYADLPDEDRRLVLDLPHRLRRMDAGAYMVREGDRPTQCTVLVSGYAYRQKVTGTGSRQILA